MQHYTVVVPAAGVGKRMQADRPKQYLHIAGKTLLEHSLERLIQHPQIDKIIVALDKHDPYFEDLPIAQSDWLIRVEGGKERADSVLAGLKAMNTAEWVLVHDAARPCLSRNDLNKLLALSQGGIGGLLATPVRDTMKRANSDSKVLKTESRVNLWHALTPQFFPYQQLLDALQQGLDSGLEITDEASAIEAFGGEVILVEGSATNIKVTHPDDLQLAEFYLSHLQRIYQ
ncbi:2-C-methyl-D-erythritol 4-phosphate cytidylyltransferase [Neptunicella sp. SCSIO 80796]|uniref:2-C-methyl-D-erythritol 4-phosphate cytidylyltransferase n=1 Tax=Neptunicella plasticusilytica TaxID=3117012 RepID=UPI003A4DBCA6